MFLQSADSFHFSGQFSSFTSLHIRTVCGFSALVTTTKFRNEQAQIASCFLHAFATLTPVLFSISVILYELSSEFLLLLLFQSLICLYRNEICIFPPGYLLVSSFSLWAPVC